MSNVEQSMSKKQSTIIDEKKLKEELLENGENKEPSQFDFQESSEIAAFLFNMNTRRSIEDLPLLIQFESEFPKLNRELSTLLSTVLKKILEDSYDKFGKEIEHDDFEIGVTFDLKKRNSFPEAAKILRAKGFRISAVFPYETFCASANLEKIQNLFDKPLGNISQEISIGQIRKSILIPEITLGTKIVDRRLRSLVSEVFIPPPFSFFSAKKQPPILPNWHLHMSDILQILGVDRAHSAGLNAKDIRVVIVDSGMDETHPAFSCPTHLFGRKTRTSVHLGKGDQYGHGTAMAGVLLSIAPECDFHLVKVFNNFEGALSKALALKPDIISCSWGIDESELNIDPKLSRLKPRIEQLIIQAIERKIIVLFASGDDYKKAWPSSFPDVISVGGVSIKPNGALIKSTVSPGFQSIFFPNRSCPDFCGLIQKDANHKFLALPTQANSELDINDATEINDGWFFGGGTSSATAQVAGIIALILQASNGRKKLTSHAIKEFLNEMAVRVGNGVSGTGAGLISFRRPNRQDRFQSPWYEIL